jgi:diketogulonate reductase-like aldo/keto reductase
VKLTVSQLSPIALSAMTPFPVRTRQAAGVLAAVPRARGATPRQVALAFLTREPHALAVPKASRSAHMVENAAAVDLVLSADEIGRLDTAFPRGPGPRRLPIL